MDKKIKPFDDLDVGGGALLRPFFQHFNLLHALIRISDCAIFTQFQSQTQSLQDGRRKSRINMVDMGNRIIGGNKNGHPTPPSVDFSGTCQQKDTLNRCEAKIGGE